MSNYTRWYTTGTASATNGSKTVSGTGSYWLSAGLNPGDMITFNGGESFSEILTINSDTQITLGANYTGATVSGVKYAIVRNFTASTPAQLAAQTADLLNDFRVYIDNDMQKLNGKSAYEIAKAHGYSGTEAQWLDYLIGAGQWSTLNERTELLTYNNLGAHNSIYRGKKLGTSITSAQAAAIKNGTYSGLYVGDYWDLTIDGHAVRAVIMGLGIYGGTTTASAGGSTALMHHAVIQLSSVWNDYSFWYVPLNDTDTCEGHIYNSKLYQETFPVWVEKISEAIQPGEMKLVYDYVADSIDATTGKVTHRRAEAGKLFLPSFFNITGLCENEENNGWQTLGRTQWPYFRHTGRSFTNTLGGTMLNLARLSSNYSATQWEFYSPFLTKIEHRGAGGDWKAGSKGTYPFFMLG